MNKNDAITILPKGLSLSTPPGQSGGDMKI